MLPIKGEDKYFAYRIGKNKGLKAGNAYLLQVIYPEDQPRSMFILNRGGAMMNGFRTGNA